MSKSKKDTMPHYEMLYLISNQFSEDELAPVMDKVEKVITDNSGTITLKEDLGKKRLAYKIKQFRHGYYELLEFDAPADVLPKINNQLRLMSDILRHQILKTEPKTKEQLEKEAKVMSELNRLEKENESQDSRTESRNRTRPVETSSRVEAVKETKEVGKEVEIKKDEEAPVVKDLDKKEDENKLELSDLDDKLNQILDTDNLL